MGDTSFIAYVEQLERDPEMKRLLDDERGRLRGDEPPAVGVREPRHPAPSGAPAMTEEGRRV